MKNQEFREWATQQCLPVFYLSSALICFFVISFHWVMPLISFEVHDSLQARLWASTPASILPILALTIPRLKKYVLEFQTLQISAMVIGIIWVTGLAKFDPYYLTSSLLGIVGASLSLVTILQVWLVFSAGVIGTIIYFLVGIHNNSVFPLFYYFSLLTISYLLAWFKVRAHRKEFYLRKSLQLAIENLRLEKSKTFIHEQLSFVGELAGNLAHEVNNPLTVFHTSLQILREKLREVNFYDEATQNLLKRCFEQTQRMKSLVDNMLYFSGKHFKEESPQNAKQLIQAAMSLVQNNAEQKQVQVELITDADEVFFLCPHRDVMQVLFHILKNAIEAAGLQREKWVRISCDFSNARNAYEICIVDSGTKVAADVQRKMFTPFIVGKEKKGHIGLGLSTSKSIVDRCDGHLDLIENQVHTAFRISFPIKL